MVKSINIDYADETTELIAFVVPRSKGEALAQAIKAFTLHEGKVIQATHTFREDHIGDYTYAFRAGDSWRAWVRFNP